MQVDLPIRRQSRLSLTPLIDVIFLLLLFFMLTSTFSRYSEVSLAGGGSGESGAASRPDVILSVTEGELKLNGNPEPLDSVVSRLEELKQAGAERLLIIVSPDAVAQDFVSVMAEVNRSGMPATVARQQR
ncbi:ExbD/TolR family protein [Hoeflea sp.]|uniref:ExbD/TolR family protein n=1 Tax=Hoeflea sp. TaxID=1940281 RepID=UPI00374961FB